MKQYTYLLAVSLGLFLTSCADDLTENLAVQNVPLSVQVMEELNSLDPLKSYKTASNISPNFKLGAALKASDLAAGGNVSALAAANFDEVVDADIMQYAACVDDNGAMNFSGVTDFVETAQKAGVGVYGQSLIWHGQQRPKYIQAMFDTRGREIKAEKQKAKEESGQNVSYIDVEVPVKDVDLTQYAGKAGHEISGGEAGENGITNHIDGGTYVAGDKVDYPFYVMGYVPRMTSEGLESKNPGGWYQYFVLNEIPADKNEETRYVAKFTVKAEADINVTVQARWSWSEDPLNISVAFKQSGDFVEVTKEFKGIKGEKFDLILQPGSDDVTFIVKKVEVVKLEQQVAPSSNWVAVKAEDLTQYAGKAGHEISSGEAGENGITNHIDGGTYVAGDKVDYPFYVMGYVPRMTSEGLESKNPGGWYQYFVLNGIPADKNEETKYRAVFTVKAEADINVTVQARWSWSEDPLNINVAFKQSGDFVEVTKEFKGIKGEKFDLILQPGSDDITFVVQKVEVFKEEMIQQGEEDSDVITVNLVENSDCEDVENKNYVIRIKDAGGDVNASFTDGGNNGKCIKIPVAAKVADAWDNQFFINIPDFEGFLTDGTIVTLELDVKADIAQKISVQTHANPGDYTGGFGDINATTEWTTYKLKGGMPLHQNNGQSHSLAFNLNDGDGVANTFYFDNITLTIEQKLPAGEIAPEEKVAILTKIMHEWIEGVMGAAGSSVQAWTVINEPVAETGDDGNGIYPLQHADAANSNGSATGETFFWQDYLGDLEYARMAVADARDAYKGEAADLKLFVNDYNLNNDADDNKKCKSLIAWIEKWEADGKTKIDGIGTELHLTCYEDAATNTKKQESITKMFELLAASKKLVKVTALDIDFQDKSGKSLQVHELTDAQQQQMADLYKFVIKTYLDKVPAAQQYGICQWSVTDSGNMPKGLWTDQFRRKLTFKGFAEGLSGK